MKKLMFAAAMAACATGAYAECAEPDEVSIPRVYQIQLNTYTTSGHALAGAVGQCGEGGDCLVLRGKDKTVLRGYVYICDEACNVSDYGSLFADVKRRGITEDEADFEWDILNAIGSKAQDAEAAWNLEATIQYDEERSQTYTLRGAGYGQVKRGATLFFDNFAGYFAGTAEGSYDFTTSTAKVGDCACERSQVVQCDTWEGAIELSLTDSDTVAFGMWKMRYNANLSKAIMTAEPTSYLLGLLAKMFK